MTSKGDIKYLFPSKKERILSELYCVFKTVYYLAISSCKNSNKTVTEKFEEMYSEKLKNILHILET